mmetsp:Transcript_65380/g.202513  ORF Transcript_65380/g.202513 Transcript_65380/m.202513 type:complete len:298 (+) Transcript_65380:236-1129(+)
MARVCFGKPSVHTREDDARHLAAAVFQGQAIPQLPDEILLPGGGHEVALAHARADPFQRVLVEVPGDEHLQSLHAGHDDADVVGEVQNVLLRGLVEECNQHAPPAHLLLPLVKQVVLPHVHQCPRHAHGCDLLRGDAAAGVRQRVLRELCGLGGQTAVRDVSHAQFVLHFRIIRHLHVVNLLGVPLLVDEPLKEEVVDDQLSQLRTLLLPLVLHRLVLHLVAVFQHIAVDSQRAEQAQRSEVQQGYVGVPLGYLIMHHYSQVHLACDQVAVDGEHHHPAQLPARAHVHDRDAHGFVG